jgi:lactoylglutathione lyase
MTSLGHVALRVKDFDRSVAFYVGQLGFEEMFRLNRDGKLWIIYIRVTDDQYIELFDEGVGDRAHAPEATGLNHFCLTVDDIDGVISGLAAAGVSLSRPKKMGLDDNLQAWVEDPDGNRIEFMQMMPGSLHMRAIARRTASR